MISTAGPPNLTFRVRLISSAYLRAFGRHHVNTTEMQIASPSSHVRIPVFQRCSIFTVLPSQPHCDTVAHAQRVRRVLHRIHLERGELRVVGGKRPLILSWRYLQVELV